MTANVFDMKKMVKRAYKYRFYPALEQVAELSWTFGCVRKVWNLALEARTTAWHQRHEHVSYLQSSAMLTQWKHSDDLGYLNEVSSVPLQQALRHLQSAYARFWQKQARYPRYKSRKKSRSAAYTRSAFRYRDGQLHLAKMTAPLAVVWSRPLPDGAEPSTVTVSRDPAGRWFVSLLCQCAVEPHPASATVVGIDAGITSLVTLSTGDKIANPRHEPRDRDRLARAQRRLARTRKGSANRDKARLKVARVHARTLVPLVQDLLGVRAPGIEPAARRPRVGMRALRYPARPGHQRRSQHQSRRAGGACLRSRHKTRAGAIPVGQPAVKQEPRQVTAGIPVLQLQAGEKSIRSTYRP